MRRNVENKRRNSNILHAMDYFMQQLLFIYYQDESFYIIMQVIR